MGYYELNSALNRRLTYKQYLFTQNYIKSGYNATKAALSSGYNVKNYNSAKCIGYQNLTKLHLREAILLQFEEVGLTKDRVCELFYQGINRCMSQKSTYADGLKGMEIYFRLLGYL